MRSALINRDLFGVRLVTLLYCPKTEQPKYLLEVKMKEQKYRRVEVLQPKIIDLSTFKASIAI